MLKIYIRADASLEIGTGHIMRCLSLAHAFRKAGSQVRFINRVLQGNLIGHIEREGFKVLRLPYNISGGSPATSRNANGTAFDQKSDARETLRLLAEDSSSAGLMITDHYSIGRLWESAVRPSVGRLMVIDDSCSKQHYCDILLDQDHLRGVRTLCGKKYVPNGCLKLLGIEYILLGGDFIKVRTHCQPKSGVVKSILVSMGGTDSSNETGKVLKALSGAAFQCIKIDVVVGEKNPNKARIKMLISRLKRFNFHCQANMAALMSKADFAIVAGGMTAWEKCCMGLPGTITVTAKNQQAVASFLDAQGAGLNLSYSDQLTARDYADALSRLLTTPRVCRRQSEKGMRLIDGKGVLRVVKAVVDYMDLHGAC